MYLVRGEPLSAAMMVRGLYIGKSPPQWGGKNIMSFGGKKYEKGKRKRGKM
jgi:hypothetical protein